MSNLILATHNPDKYREIKEILKDIRGIRLKWAGEFPQIGPVEETGSTLRENALLKASNVAYLLKQPAIADDTGLFVESLGNRPGVRSSRYAGEDAGYDDNINKLLRELENFPQEKRKAEFKTVVSLVLPGGKKYFTSGTVKGRITPKRMGKGGFGYDPVFLVEGKGKTFSQMSEKEKNTVSHRYIAFKNAVEIIEREVA